jgi:hypothetical protein
MGTKIFNGLPIELKNEMNLNVLINSDMDCRLISSPVSFLTLFILCS